jgi:hypothetical protein
MVASQKDSSSYASGKVSFAIKAMLYNTNNAFAETVWFNTTRLGETSVSGAYNSESPRSIDAILVLNGGVYYIVVSSGWKWDTAPSPTTSITAIFSISSSGAILKGTSVTTSADATSLTTSCFLYGASYWFPSSTELNTIYTISLLGGSTTNFTTYKINLVTPTLTLLFNKNYGFNGLQASYLDYTYVTIGSNSYYDVLFAHSVSGVAKQINVEFLRFNDTSFVNCWQTTYLDSGVFGNQVRIIDIYGVTGVWSYGTLQNGGGYNTDTSSAYVILYVGQLAKIMAINFYMTNLNTISPTFSFSPSGAYQWQLGTHYFTTSNNVGGWLSPYGYGNMIQIDYQNSQAISNYFQATNPATALHTSWSITPLVHDKWYIQPSQYGSYSLSQNLSYLVTGSLLVQGSVITTGTYSIWSTDELTTSTTPSSYINSITTNAQIFGDGSILFNVDFDSRLTKTTTYESYLINVTSGGVTYPFILYFGWFFVDYLAVPLPNSYIGEYSGYDGITSTSDGGGIDAILPTLEAIFGNVKTDFVFIIFGVICGLLTWKFALVGLVAGIGISTFLCTLANLLPIWAVGLCIVLDVTIIILGSGLLNKTNNNSVK